jgi:putative glycosyltransferase
MPRNLLMARLMSRRYVDSLLLHQEREVALGGLWQITGFKQIPVVIQKLDKGTTTYNLYRRIGLSIKHITSFTNRPLILIAVLGIIILFIAFLYLMYTLYVFFIIGETPSGFTSIILSIWFLGGLTIFSLGVIAIYLSVIFNETKKRPLTIIKDFYERRNNGTNGKT